MKRQLERAVRRQDYEQAARLLWDIREGEKHLENEMIAAQQQHWDLERQMPLQDQLQLAVEREDYEHAAAIRDRILQCNDVTQD